MMLQLQEYRTRVRTAFQSTYRHPLAIAASNTPGSPSKRDAHSGNYCRSRILESSRQLFTAEARSRARAAPLSPSSPPRSTLKAEGGVAFHRTTTSSRTAVKSSLFALGPGQYDVVPRRPATTGSVKFSPADRFREHAGGGIADSHAPGPGQYLPDDRFIAKRSARVVFSQLPRQTQTAEPPRGSIAVAPATADVVSSYYYVPASGFAAPGDMASKSGGGIPNWSRSPRFPGRRREIFQNSAQNSPAIDYIARNKAAIESMSAEQRQRRRMREAAIKPQPRITVSQAWSTLVVLSVAQTKFVRLLVVAAVLHRLRRAQELRYKRITFQSWTHVRDREAMRSLAAALIASSTFSYRLRLRVERKIRAANLLRSFLSGLSVDVRFAMAVRRVQRRIIVLQRWWRRARLVVRAREQCLAYKWLVVEHRLRTEHIAQMPHLQRVFQPPATAGAFSPAGASSALAKRRASVVGASVQTVAVEAQLPLHKLLNLPEQKRWFTARFVLSPDGVLRAYATDSERLEVEVKHFRCHGHGFANASPSSTRGAENEGDVECRPYLMVFRPGASRFVLITDASSLVLAPLLDWKDKLERLAGYPLGSPFPGGGSQRDIADMLAQTNNAELEEAEEAPGGSSRRISIPGGSNGERVTSMSQVRKRSSRQRLRRSNAAQPIAEGELSYYVVDLLRDCPRIPAPIVWGALRDKLREERKNFRSEIYRFKLEIARYQQHERDRRQLVVLDKFKEFFTMERPRHPHFRSLISHRKMEALVRQTIEFVKTSQPYNPRFMLPS
ncbi:hypothetical protein PHYSODRAFT_509844 [Phytophthora sojae]|uniref:Uncharacterized protein n=1 Tax=Phytophthora sojae (strain P6497) TaxID=1094619 RepID=G4ZPC3_PHYSP|nr:hypothetical protein PHYSODRAFT_509844 [Phytophthora sojae]EGZ15457.1 hypothetical protein PHYSODRAFT_509844 [Phytophthora sojae]|eukprot:XP_009529206.1 hypothetical protein PHYSODRAFT_509844 [Phytophthora sojae]